MGAWSVPPVLILGTAIAGVIALLAQQVFVARIPRRDLGLRVDDLRRAAPPAAIATAVFAGAAVAWALVSGRPLRSHQLAWMLPLYPFWGLAHQTLFQGILHRNLRRIASAPVATLVTAAAFALVHWGRLELVGLTAVAGLVWSLLYARCGNVIVLGLSHGIAAALAYPLIMGYDPLVNGG